MSMSRFPCFILRIIHWSFFCLVFSRGLYYSCFTIILCKYYSVNTDSLIVCCWVNVRPCLMSPTYLPHFWVDIETPTTRIYVLYVRCSSVVCSLLLFYVLCIYLLGFFVSLYYLNLYSILRWKTFLTTRELVVGHTTCRLLDYKRAGRV